ncbi:unnamed protein product [Linum tenue]|uniref:WAT1-related protein n=1 Tax=Linum tenue TaxID=586396 RepID=A0AAV0H311_9ROSI|nr:unnamed protein product [Linum tenue]
MVMAECAQVGLMIVSKEAMSQGMSSFIFVLYSNSLACLVLLPASLIYHRFERNSTNQPCSIRTFYVTSKLFSTC